MVRKGSPVRVRQRALKSAPQRCSLVFRAARLTTSGREGVIGCRRLALAARLRLAGAPRHSVEGTHAVHARRTGLDTGEVKHGVTELAAAFFGTVLKHDGDDGIHFTRYLAPKWLAKHVPMVGSAEAHASADAFCPPGQDVVCED
jgi:hypothetical protein